MYNVSTFSFVNKIKIKQSKKSFKILLKSDSKQSSRFENSIFLYYHHENPKLSFLLYKKPINFLKHKLTGYVAK